MSDAVSIDGSADDGLPLVGEDRGNRGLWLGLWQSLLIRGGGPTHAFGAAPVFGADILPVLNGCGVRICRRQAAAHAQGNPTDGVWAGQSFKGFSKA